MIFCDALGGGAGYGRNVLSSSPCRIRFSMKISTLGTRPCRPLFQKNQAPSWKERTAACPCSSCTSRYHQSLIKRRGKRALIQLCEQIPGKRSDVAFCLWKPSLLPCVTLLFSVTWGIFLSAMVVNWPVYLLGKFRVGWCPGGLLALKTKLSQSLCITGSTAVLSGHRSSVP